MNEELQAAIERIANSDAAGIAHEAIYGYSVDKDLVVLGREFLKLKTVRGIATNRIYRMDANAWEFIVKGYMAHGFAEVK